MSKLEEKAITITYPLAFKRGIELEKERILIEINKTISRELEKERILTEISNFKSLFKNRKIFHIPITERAKIMKGFDNLEKNINQFNSSKQNGGEE